MRERLAYSIKEMVKDSTVSRTKIYEEIKAGNLRAVKCGGRTLVLHEDRQRWLSKLKPMGAAGAKPPENQKAEAEDDEDKESPDAEPP